MGLLPVDFRKESEKGLLACGLQAMGLFCPEGGAPYVAYGVRTVFVRCRVRCRVRCSVRASRDVRFEHRCDVRCSVFVYSNIHPTCREIFHPRFELANAGGSTAVGWKHRTAWSPSGFRKSIGTGSVGLAWFPFARSSPHCPLPRDLHSQDGSYLAEFLLDKDYEVHGIIRRSSSFNTNRIEHIYQDRHREEVKLFLHYGDLTDSTNLVQIVSDAPRRDLQPRCHVPRQGVV